MAEAASPHASVGARWGLDRLVVKTLERRTSPDQTTQLGNMRGAEVVELDVRNQLKNPAFGLQ